MLIHNLDESVNLDVITKKLDILDSTLNLKERLYMEINRTRPTKVKIKDIP